MFNGIMKKKDCMKAWRSVRRTIKGKHYKVEGITSCEKCQKLHNCKFWEGIAIREGQNVIKVYHI